MASQLQHADLVSPKVDSNPGGLMRSTASAPLAYAQSVYGPHRSIDIVTQTLFG